MRFNFFFFSIQIISSQKNKSPIPLSLPNRLRPRRKNKSKPSEANRFDNLTDDGEPTSVGRNGRRTLYTKGNSDCEDNDAVSNAAQSLNAQPSTSNAAQRESNLTEPQNPQINANPSDSTSENPSKNISFENNSVLANSTMRTATEPAMTTMADNRPNDLSDIIEEVPVAISTERVTGTTEKVNPKRSQKAAKSNAKTKAVPKRTQRVRNVKETAVNTSNETAETVCVRRSRRARTANAWATHGPIGVYEWACQKASSAKRRPSPARTMDPEPEPDGESRVTTSKRRRIADKAKQTTKARADTREDTEVAVDSKSTNKKQQKKQTPATKQTALSHRNNLCQIAKDLGWFNDLCNTKALPTLVSQEGLYKIHMNQVGTVKIGKFTIRRVRLSTYSITFVLFMQKAQATDKYTIFRMAKSIMAISRESFAQLVLCDSTKVAPKVHRKLRPPWYVPFLTQSKMNAKLYSNFTDFFRIA